MDLRTQRLRKAVQAAGGNHRVAQRAEMPTPTLNNYMSGRDMKAAAMVALAAATGVRVEWLATGVGPMHERDLEAPTAQPPAHEAAAIHVIPRYAARASAGAGNPHPEEVELLGLPFPEIWIRQVIGRSPHGLVIVDAAGDSMEPTISDGDLLLLDTAARDLRNGRIYVIETAGNLLVKRVQLRIDGSIILVSDNPNYPPESVAPGGAERLRIIGQVVWQSRAMAG
ncbi:S24 family peptidase [Humitalea rosea]|nr:helix-turn-helix transcriptional regulator [Humitalea rosea]